MHRYFILSLLIYYVSGYCPPTGPVFPPPMIPANFQLPGVSVALDYISKGNTTFNNTTNSFSILISSRNSTFFEYHHTAAARNAAGVQKVDKNTVYRVASNTKMFTTLALMLEFPNLDDWIGNYVPELVDDLDYKDITLRLLASQLSGVPRDGGTFDRFTLVGPQLEKAGFPVPAPADVPDCDTGIGSPPCSRAQFFNGITTNKLAWRPADRAAYSDQAYIILGYAFANKTGKSFQQVIEEKITAPLGLNFTGFVGPELSKGIIPSGPGSAWFSLDISNFKATAGLYSTPADISSFLRAILSNRLLTPAKTRAWLKPQVFTSSPTTSVGMPWEIFRVTTATPDKRPIDLYTKSGNFGVYAAWAVLIPEYDVAVAIHAAGEDAERVTVVLVDLVAKELVPALEGLARRQAERAYAGKYVSPGNGSDSLSLVVDDGPGVKIMSWKYNGTDVFNGLGIIVGEKPAEIDARLYPFGAEGRWRMGLEAVAKGTGFLETQCRTWMNVDQLRYAKQPLDEFDFEYRDDGSVFGVRNLGLRSEMVRKGKGGK